MKNGRMSMVYDGRTAGEMTKDELILAIFREREIAFDEGHIWAMGEAFRCGFLAGEDYAEEMFACSQTPEAEPLSGDEWILIYPQDEHDVCESVFGEDEMQVRVDWLVKEIGLDAKDIRVFAASDEYL